MADEDEWAALNRGTGRESFDSPSRFDLSSVSRVTHLARRVRPQQGGSQQGHGQPGHGQPAQGQQGRGRAPAAPPPRAVPPPPRFTHRSLVRPYARTGGRTRPGKDLALESLVVTTERGMRYEGVHSPEQRYICDLCVEVHSVAEIAAFAKLPLGVVKIIVDDLGEVGAVDIQQPGFVLADRGSRDFMERILTGLRAL